MESQAIHIIQLLCGPTLRATLQIMKELGAGPSQLNNETARNVLLEELGHYGEWAGPGYSLNDATRNRLLAHGRQDAAYAAINSSDVLKLAHKIYLAIKLLAILIVVCTAIIILSV